MLPIQPATAFQQNGPQLWQVLNSITAHVYMTEIKDDTPLNHYISSNVEELTGYPQANFISNWRFWNSIIHPDDRRLSVAQFNKFKQGQASTVEYRLVRADGQTIWVRDSGRVERDPATGNWLVYGLVSDTTERKQLENRLAAIYRLGQELTLLHQQRAILNRVLETVAQTLPAEQISVGLVEDNTHQLQIYIYDPANGLPEQPHRQLPLADQESISVTVVRTGQAQRLTHTRSSKEYLTPDNWYGGSELCVPLKLDEHVLGVLNVESVQPQAFSAADQQILQMLADQTAVALENARLVEQSWDQYRRLQQSQAQLVQVEKMAALGRLVASIAHEINNPLQSVQHGLALIAEELETSQQPELIDYIDLVTQEIMRVATIVRRMRDFYRPTQNLKRQLPSTIEIDSFDSFYRPQADELHSIDLHQVLEDVLQLANKQLQHSHITVERFWEPTLPPMRGNPDYLKQVFLNLVLNAIDALSMGGGVLRISTALASIQRPADTKPRPAARLEFSDTGAGISPEALAHLFEPLFTTKGHGSGLGLFISYKIIEGHQGQILVNSAAGQGTTFTILLPLNQNQDS